MTHRGSVTQSSRNGVTSGAAYPETLEWRKPLIFHTRPTCTERLRRVRCAIHSKAFRMHPRSDQSTGGCLWGQWSHQALEATEKQISSSCCFINLFDTCEWMLDSFGSSCCRIALILSMDQHLFKRAETAKISFSLWLLNKTGTPNEQLYGSDRHCHFWPEADLGY